MAFDKNMADGTPPGTGPESAPSGSKPSDFEKKSPYPPGTKFTEKGRPIWPGTEGWATGQKRSSAENPKNTEKPNPADYPPGTLFTRSGKPIFRVAGGAEDTDESAETSGHHRPEDNVTPETPPDPMRGEEEKKQWDRDQNAAKGFPQAEVDAYRESVANEGREQSFYNIYQELEYYKQNRQFGKLRQRVNNILATLDIDEAGEAPGVGEMLQYINVVFAEPQYESFRSEISNWIEARQITHNVAFAAKYLKCEQWGSGITNIRGRHLKALMREAGVQQASDLLEGWNDDADTPSRARGHYYRVKDEGIKDQNLVNKIVDGANLTNKEKEDTWTLRQKIKLIDQMWDDFGVGEDKKPKDFLGMTDVFKIAGLTDFPDKTKFYSDEGVFQEYQYDQALKKYYQSIDINEAKKKVEAARTKYRGLMIHGMNYMITSDALDKYHSAHRAINRIKQEGEEGNPEKAKLLMDASGKKIVTKTISEYFAYTREIADQFPIELKEKVEEALPARTASKINEENARRNLEGKPAYTDEERQERIAELRNELTPALREEIKPELEKVHEAKKAKFVLERNLKSAEVENLDPDTLSNIHLEDIEQVFGHLNRAFVIAEKIHHASGQSADFDGLKWKKGVAIPEELKGGIEQFGYENVAGDAVVFDPVFEWYDDDTREIDPETGSKKMFSGNKITLHLAQDMMPESPNDTPEVKKRKKIAQKLARERSGELAKAWADHQRMIYERYAHLIDFNASIGGRGARDKKKLHHKPADYWNDGELNPGRFKELRKYGYVNTVTIQQFFQLGTNAQLAEEWDRFFNRIKYNTGRWNAMEKVQGMFDKSGPRLLYDFHAMETPDQIIKTLGEFFKASLALTEFDDHHGANELNEFIGSLARGIFEFRTKHSEKYDFNNLNWNQLELLNRKLTLSHMVAHHESERLNREYLGNDLYQFMRDLYEKTNKRGLFSGFLEGVLKQLAATMQAFVKG